ncbi:GumC family protein [Sphingorhabdus sp.]|uniref:GumC family protein n=1 Tax=Sphingorhabdus sp. TaxID=1902408 RepID=UPI003918EFEE
MTGNAEYDANPNGSQAVRQLAPPIILQYWQVVLRWKWLIAGILIAALVVGLTVTLLMTPQYTAKSRIEINREQKNITNVDSLESRDVGQDLEFYQTQYSLLEARSLAERVARELKLATADGFFEAHGIDVNGTSGMFATKTGPVSSAEYARREATAVDLLIGHVEIVPVRGSALIDVSYTSASPQLSARISNAWTQQFIAASMDRRFASTADARKFLEGRLADLRARLEQSQRDLVNYASSKGIVSLARTVGPDGKTQIERTLAATDLEALNNELAEATADRIAAESKARMVKKLK